MSGRLNFRAKYVIMNIIGMLMIAGALIPGKIGVGPTAENALAAEQEVTRALLTNDADALGRMLADDWIVVSAYGGIGQREGFLAEIKSGQFTRKTMELSDPRVKIYGNTAVVTTHLKTSGTIDGRDFDVFERQTDVLVWSDGAWKSVLLHETMVHK
jgi:ketosteroid isomerase-like protein